MRVLRHPPNGIYINDWLHILTGVTEWGFLRAVSRIVDVPFLENW